MTIKQFNAIKLEKKRQLCRVIEEHEGVALDPSFISTYRSNACTSISASC